VDYVLVTPLVLFLVGAVIELGMIAYTRTVLTSAAEDAVRTAAAFDGDTVAGSARFRELIAREVAPTAVRSIEWYGTLDTLTLRVTSEIPVIGPLVPMTMTTTASAYSERWP
jgi:Flp pilus assembly protein TadG